MQYALLDLHAPSRPRAAPEDRCAAEIAELRRVHPAHPGPRHDPGRRGAPADVATATTVRVATAGRSRPTGRSPRPRRRSAGSTSSRRPTSTRRSRYAAHDPGRAARLHRGPARSWTARDAGRPAAASAGKLTPRRPRLTDADAAHEVVDRLFREEQGRAVATLIRVTRRLRPRRGGRPGRVHHAPWRRWPRAGRPGQPGRLDHHDGAESRDRPAAPAPSACVEKTRGAGARGRASRRSSRRSTRARRRKPMPIADDRLRLIFTCCHPALAMDARVALTLRTLGGLTTPEIARAFLVPEPTLAQRLVRAKRRSATPGSRTACRRPSCCRSGSMASCGSCTSSSTRATRRRRGMR